MVYLWCTKYEKRYNQKKLNRKPYLSNMLTFIDNSYNGLYRFSLRKNIPCRIPTDSVATDRVNVPLSALTES